MATIDVLFRVAPEFKTTDPVTLATIAEWIADATSDEPIKSTDARYQRLLAYRTAAMMTDSSQTGSTNSGGYGIRREKTSLGEIEYQTVKSGGASAEQYTNKYWGEYWRLRGLSGRSAGFVARCG